MIRVGEKLRVAPVFAKHDGGTPRYMTGKVVYIHPKGRYAVLEFKGVHGKSREGFTLWDLLHKKNKQEGGGK